MDVLGIFLGLEHGRILAVYGGKESSQISSNIVICVLTMNTGITGLEQHEGE